MKRTFSEKFCWLITLLVVFPLQPLLFPMKVVGKEHLPKEGAAIIACNHISLLDPVFISRISYPRKISWFAKSELFEKKLLRWFLGSLLVIPVKRGTADMGAIKAALTWLKNNQVFAIFPEGTRNKKQDGSLGEFNTGIGLISLMSKAPVIPAYIRAENRVKLFRKIHISIGEPLDLSDLAAHGANSERTKEATRRIQEKIRELS